MRRTIPWFACALGAGLLGAPRFARAAEIVWKGYTWSVTNGGMAGVAEGSTANVSIDASGNLHLKIQKNGDTWTAAEIFTTARLGFGTYQWQIDGAIDKLDKNVVLGLFPYGPAAGIGSDGTNEIDIEYSRWGNANGPNGDWTNYPASGSIIGELSYTFSLDGGTLSTSRFIWTKDSIEDFLFAGLQPPSSTASSLESWQYAPANPSTNIPQQALPLGMNLWCFAIPADGKNVEIVVRDFQFVPEGAGTGGAGGAGSSSGGVSAGGAVPAGGATSAGGASSAIGGASADNGMSIGGSSSTAGATSLAGSSAFAGGASGLQGGAGEAHAESAAGQLGMSAGESSGCNCRVGRLPRSTQGGLSWLFTLLLLTRFGRRFRRRAARSPRSRRDNAVGG